MLFKPMILFKHCHMCIFAHKPPSEKNVLCQVFILYLYETKTKNYFGKDQIYKLTTAHCVHVDLLFSSRVYSKCINISVYSSSFVEWLLFIDLVVYLSQTIWADCV